MKKALKKLWRKVLRRKAFQERGSALIIVTLILALLTIYVSASLTLTTTDTVSSNFEVSQQSGYYTAFAKLEQMSRDFSSLFINSPSPSYDSLCRVVVAPPNLLNNFRIVTPNVSCPSGSPCVPGYSGVDFASSNVLDLGWVGQSSFCVVDVCNPNNSGCSIAARPPYPVQISSGTYAGLQAFARQYRQVATVTNQVRGGSDVQLTRDFTNFLLPLFQFGIFSDSDFELYTPPNWQFGGWVHTNNDFYVTGGQATGNVNRFSQYVSNGSTVTATPARISVVKHVLVGQTKYGATVNGSDLTVVTDTMGGTTQYTQGSALTGAQVPGTCNKVSNASIDVPAGTCVTPGAGKVGNGVPTVTVGASRLQLPIQNILGANPIQLIRRGLAMDFNPALSSPYLTARYYYKPTLRVTLADYQSQLPKTVQPGEGVNPTAATGPYGGVQLDGPDPILGMTGPGAVRTTGNSSTWFYMQDTGGLEPLPRGYQPKVISPTTGAPRPTGARVNGFRIHGWIKIEVVKADGSTLDLTQEILNLGVTVPYVANAVNTNPVYFPRVTPGFPPSVPLAGGSTGPFPDENSIIHLQRMAVPYTASILGGLGTALPANLTSASGIPTGLDNVSNSVIFDYYSSMAMRRYNSVASLQMFGIEDDANAGVYRTNLGGANPYAEPQNDQGGYYTDANAVPSLPANSAALTPHRIDFTGTGNSTRTGSNTLYGENTNNPKAPSATTPNTASTSSVYYVDGETSWSINDSTNTLHRLVPFPINMFDSREGTPHEPNSGVTTDPPVPGLNPTSVSKVGTMNLIEFDMGNLGRLLKGDFDNLFSQMGNTPYKLSAGTPLVANALKDNINVNLDNGWLVYVSDRRGDEPVLTSNPNVKPGASAAVLAGDPSLIGDGEYAREDVLWNTGGVTTGGNPDYVRVATGPSPAANNSANVFGCDAALVSDNKDNGKSPQDANNDCFISREIAGAGRGFSETAPYGSGFYSPSGANVDIKDQYSDRTYSTVANNVARAGNMIALTEVPTNAYEQATWSRKPPVMFPDPTVAGATRRIELFRRAVRLVNASNLFPTGPVPSSCSFPLGVTFVSENPVYVFGNFNAPAGETSDFDTFPGLGGTGATTTNPTSPLTYNGSDYPSCGNNCNVPAGIIADAISLLSGPCVGTGTVTGTSWSGAGGTNGWLDTRSFVTPYQAVGYRPARNTAYRFALVSGYTPSWYPTYWNNVNGSPTTAHQGNASQYSSGALNNFPRFLEDWGLNGQSGNNRPFATYAGSLIRIYKSTQANGTFKRVSSAGSATSLTGPNNQVDYVYVPPNRDWIFDTNFNNPCTLPPGSPFLQLVDFKGFQQSQVQR